MTSNYKEFQINDIVLRMYDSSIIVSSYNQSIKKEVLDKINLILSKSNLHEIDSIIIIINNNMESITSKEIIQNDYMNLFACNNITKYKLNKSNIYTQYNEYIKSNPIKTKFNVPTELLLNDKQLYQMIIGEIEKVNNNITHNHYIVVKDDKIFNLSVRFRYVKGELGKYMQEFNKKHNYDYFEILLTVSHMYPFLVPTLQYIKPSIHIDLLHSIINMPIWELSNWNYTISLDTLITNLGNTLEPLFLQYILPEQIEYNTTELLVLQLAKKTKNLIQYNLIPIDINYITLKQMTHTIKLNDSNKVWASGTGYGSSSSPSWDISQYINTIKQDENYVITILQSIVMNLKNDIKMVNYSMNQILEKYIINIFHGINLLDFNKSLPLYHEIINIINIHVVDNINLSESFINNVITNTKELYNIIQSLITLSLSDKDKDLYITIYKSFIDMINMITTQYKICIENTIEDTII